MKKKKVSDTPRREAWKRLNIIKEGGANPADTLIREGKKKGRGEKGGRRGGGRRGKKEKRK